jgi:hypothetical protein
MPRRLIAPLGLLAAILALSPIGIAEIPRRPEPAGGPPAFDPSRGIYWLQQSAAARPDVVAELDELTADLAALRALAEKMEDKRAAASLEKRIRSAESHAVALRERLEAVLPPTAFANVRVSDFQVLVPVQIPPTPVPPPPPPPPVAAGPSAMDREDFAALSAQVARESFESSKLGVLEAAAPDRHFTVDQVAALLRHFSFDNSRFDAAALLLPRVIDRDNAYRLLDSFTFDSDKERMKDLILGK